MTGSPPATGELLVLLVGVQAPNRANITSTTVSEETPAAVFLIPDALVNERWLTIVFGEDSLPGNREFILPIMAGSCFWSNDLL